MTPNHSLNRPLHSVPLFALAKTLAQIPPHCSGPVSSNVSPHMAAPSQLHQPNCKIGRRVFPLRFWQVRSMPLLASRPKPDRVRRLIDAQRDYGDVVRMAPNDIQPRLLFCPMAPAVLVNWQRPASEFVASPRLWQPSNRPKRRSVGMLKHTPKLPHFVNSPQRKCFFVGPWFCPSLQLSPSPARRVGNNRRTTWPVSGVALNIPNVTAGQQLVMAVRASKQYCNFHNHPICAVRANPSLNLTLCGGPILVSITFQAKIGPPQSAG